MLCRNFAWIFDWMLTPFFLRNQNRRSSRLVTGGRRPPRRRVVECPNRTPAIGTAMAPVSKNFGPQNCGAVPRTSVEDQDAARMIEDYYDFPTGSDFGAVQPLCHRT